MPQYIGSVYLDVRADASRLGSDLTRAGQSAGASAGAAAGTALNASMGSKLEALGTQATRVGRQLTIGLSAPLIGLGVASEKAFLAYDTNMTKVAALTGVGAQATAAMSDEVLAMASKYGIAGEDAANALYLIESSGIRGQAAMDTLETSLQTSAVGMGDAATMAGLLTSAMNAYGPANLSAAQAADVLTGAVRESKVPADQLAGSISQLLPFGRSLGVSFAEITGGMAALSLQGTNAAQAATQLRGIFNGMLDPSSQAARNFLEVGLSAEQLRDTLSKGGIVAMLRQLQGAIVRSGQEANPVLADTFGNVRALTGVMALLNDEGGQIDRVFANTTNSAGKLNVALNITADSAGMKARVATAELHNEMIKLGEDVAPVQTALLGVARAGVAMINALGPFKEIVVIAGTALAVLGPASFLFGTFANSAKLIQGFMATLAASETAAAGATGTLAAAEAALAAATTAAADAEAELVVAMTTGDAALIASAVETHAAAAAEVELAASKHAAAVATAEGTAATGGMAAAMGGLAAAAGPVAGVIAGIVGVWTIWNKAMEVGRTHVEGVADTFNNRLARGGIKDAQAEAKKLADQMNALADEEKNSGPIGWFFDLDYYATLNESAEKARQQIDEVNQDIAVSRELAKKSPDADPDNIFNWLRNQRNAGKTFKDSAEAWNAYMADVAKGGGVISTAATATGRLVDRAKDLASAFFGAQSAQKAYNDSLTKVEDAQRGVADAGRALDDARRAETDSVRKVTDAQQKHRDALDKVADAQRTLADATTKLNELEQGPTLDERLDVKSARLALARARQSLTQGGGDALDRQSRQIDVQRAKEALTEARGAHDVNLAAARKAVVDAQRGVTDAQRAALDAADAIADAQRGVADAHRGVEAAMRGVEKANVDLYEAQLNTATAADAAARAQAGFDTALKNSGDHGKILIDYLNELLQLYPAAATGLEDSLARAHAAQDAYNAANAPPDPYAPLAPGVQGPNLPPGYYEQQKYAPLAPGVQGPNLPAGYYDQKTQSVSAQSIAPFDLDNIPVAGGDGGVTTGDIIVYDHSGVPRQTAFEMRREIRKEAFLAGRRS